MMLFLPFKKATLLIPSGPANDPSRKHLFVLLTGPTQLNTEKNVLLVSFSSCKRNVYFDPTCTITPGEHPFIREASYVLYSKARIEPVDALLRGVKAGSITPHSQVSDALFQRISVGLVTSPHTRKRIIDFYNDATNL